MLTWLMPVAFICAPVTLHRGGSLRTSLSRDRRPVSPCRNPLSRAERRRAQVEHASPPERSRVRLLLHRPDPRRPAREPDQGLRDEARPRDRRDEPLRRRAGLRAVAAGGLLTRRSSPPPAREVARATAWRRRG